MSAILRVKDDSGNVIEIPAIKGDKGDQGVSGVYYGDGDMPDGYDVQIYTDGDANPFYVTATLSDIVTTEDAVTAKCTVSKSASDIVNMGEHVPVYVIVDVSDVLGISSVAYLRLQYYNVKNDYTTAVFYALYNESEQHEFVITLTDNEDGSTGTFKYNALLGDIVYPTITEGTEIATIVGKKIYAPSIPVLSVNGKTGDVIIQEHNHENKNVLDEITQEDISSWNSKATLSDIPTTLPNPNKLLLNGTEYDGTSPVDMTIKEFDGKWSVAQDITLENDISSYQLSFDDKCYDVIIYYFGRVNNTSNSLSDSTSSWNIHINNSVIQPKFKSYISKSSSYYSIVELTNISSYMLVQSQLFTGNCAEQAYKYWFPIDMSTRVGNGITKIDLSPLVPGHVLKAGCRLVVFKR